ncbi:GyrI-like domain-containing protein [Nesterenkonia flava]|uniref:GyrI-like domain-containing protein n=1 Tax=Nesterenkonia flava TaxID=469799 RepID=A0ABU1FTI9_9MICC|nr:GyrI-like domain-containing protein [Nesterenkonia flava]MDR5711981.1 GyrI-like domain-containing protein [Nesterenkonia flava]
MTAALEQVRRKKAPALLEEVRWELLLEGTAVQTLHIGPYDDEAEVLAAMHQKAIPARGLSMPGRHHEIYLSDPRRTVPQKLRTILRQPVATLPAAHAAS